VLSYGGSVGTCGTFLAARGIGGGELLEGGRHSSIQTLTDWIQEVDRVLSF